MKSITFSEPTSIYEVLLQQQPWCIVHPSKEMSATLTGILKLYAGLCISRKHGYHRSLGSWTYLKSLHILNMSQNCLLTLILCCSIAVSASDSNLHCFHLQCPSTWISHPQKRVNSWKIFYGVLNSAPQ